MKILISMDVAVPMRDGVELATHVWQPDVDDPVPALLVRLPYSKDNLTQVLGIGAMPRILSLVEAGYAVALQDCRGTGRSHGEFTPFVDDARDGQDTIEWLAAQPWCDGSVGMYGGSYLGIVQLLAASTRVAPLKAIAPSVAPVHVSRPGDTLRMSLTLGWATSQALQAAFMGSVDHPPAAFDDAASGQSSFGLVQMMGDMDSVFEHTPVLDHPTLLAHAPWLPDLLRAPSDSGVAFGVDVDLVHLPGLHIGGWYDVFVKDTIQAYTAMCAAGPPAGAEQRLVVGPWTHLNLNGLFPDRAFGLGAVIDSLNMTAIHLAWFDAWLKGDRTALDGMAPVKLFVMGVDEWRDFQEWPPAGVERVDLHLDGGPANSVRGDGRLAADAPARRFTQTFLYDPRRPVPTVGGEVVAMDEFGGPADQRDVEARDDVLCFTTEVLDRDLTVIGPVSATLFVSSSAVDTDFTAKLVDVEPDGRAILVCDGIRRMRHRRSRTTVDLLEPGEVHRLTIDVGPTAIVFRAGHRIRLEVSSSNFPKYDRNSGTGGDLLGERLDDMVVAVNHVHHGPEHPSVLTLPVVP